jgi:ferredoxin
MTLLQANVAAALNKTALSFNDKQIMEQYAKETSCRYCTGCAEKCEVAIADAVPISNTLFGFSMNCRLINVSVFRRSIIQKQSSVALKKTHSATDEESRCQIRMLGARKPEDKA